MLLHRRTVMLLGLGLWLVAVTGLHLGLNVDWSELQNERLPEEARKLHVAYIPVT